MNSVLQHIITVFSTNCVSVTVIKALPVLGVKLIFLAYSYIDLF